MRVLVVYNICGCRARDGVGGEPQDKRIWYYEKAIDSILAQDHKDFKVVVSSCRSMPNVVTDLWTQYNNRVSFNWIESALPLGVTFNHSILLATEEFGSFDAVLYVDSGIMLQEDENNRTDKDNSILSEMCKAMESGPYAMIAAKASNDDGYTHWGLYDIMHSMKEVFVMPVGRTANLHCQLFSTELVKAYGRVLPDIFTSDSSESVFTFMCAAINMKFCLTPFVQVTHRGMLDGASNVYGRGNKLAGTPHTMKEIYAAGEPFGFGYEEIPYSWAKRTPNDLTYPHNAKLYDEQDNALKADELRKFIAAHLFIPMSAYDKINFRWDPCQS